MNAANIRQELLEAARTFILKDPDHFSIAALCRQTGIRKSQLRAHFPTKNDLMSALVEDGESGGEAVHPFPADEAWVKNRFHILERALTLLESRTEEIARGQAAAADNNPADGGTRPGEESMAEPPPVVIAPGTPPALLEMPPLPIEKPATMFDAREKLRAIVRQMPKPAKPSAAEALKKAPDWLWTVAMVWGGAVAFIAILVFASRPTPQPQPLAAPVRAASLPAKAARPAHASGKSVAIRQGDVLVIDATGAAVAMNESGDAGAEALAAIKYLKGDGVEADPGMAMRHGQNAAAKGNAEAEFVVGALYAKGMAPDPVRAAAWYRRAAEQGHAKAMFNLAMAYLSGQGVAKDTDEALAWFAKAADAGYADAAVNLGVLYERGGAVTRDRHEALTWYRRAAGLGDAQAAARVRKLEGASAAATD